MPRRGGIYDIRHQLANGCPPVSIDLPLTFHPAAIRASAVVNRPRFLDQLRLEFSGS
ncbi:hypothetical protein AGR4C_Cc160194 [Agrobacterium tumefaciens str. Kerr 14]|uniref:Uncharacterized protein n=1 Tax=Agrobacterium tumefaciens str. Kerr 14 TaxID=1183424 RepID=A0A1S7P8P1_AGRTU|nr:hypothetical protein AGR4C_Cc160194 [Agrobacterium tumefaciens str. Kerr 14]